MTLNMAGERGDQIGRISPIGPLFTLGGFLITEVAQIFGLLFSAVQVFQKCIGQHFGRFFSKKNNLVTLPLSLQTAGNVVFIFFKRYRYPQTACETREYVYSRIQPILSNKCSIFFPRVGHPQNWVRRSHICTYIEPV
jgi:hypothetical protein